VLVHVSLHDGTADADHLEVRVSVGGHALADLVPHTPGAVAGSLEVDFPSGYPRSKHVIVDLIPYAGRTSLGEGVAELDLSASCMTAEVDVVGTLDGTVTTDLLSADAFDLAGADLLLPTGASCSGDNECGSRHCVDHYCCDGPCSGACEACDVSMNEGTCTPVTAGQPHGSRPGCDGAGTTCGGACSSQSRTACLYPGSTTSCRAQSCVGGMKTAAAVCDGAGGCPPPQVSACTAGCSGNDCVGACGPGDTGCSGGTPYCNGGVCMATRPTGRTCMAASECTSTFCVDGYCCGSSCTAACQACDVSSNPGNCTTLISGQPHHKPACGGGGICQGSCQGQASCSYPGASTTCASQKCSNSSLISAGTCNGTGGCTPGMGSLCPGNLTCTPDGTACRTSCTMPSDCTNNVCSNGRCCASACNGIQCGMPDPGCGGQICGCGGGQTCFNGSCCLPKPCDPCTGGDDGCGTLCPPMKICPNPMVCCPGLGCTCATCCT
jgi:hypothetical protein